MRIGYSRKFAKQYKKLSNPIQQNFKKRLSLFLENPKHSILSVHKLQGKFVNLYSINITGDIRAVYEKMDKENVEFVAIDSHSELYS